jgi:hypothetical protein
MKSAYLLFLTLVTVVFLGFLVPQSLADDVNGISIQNVSVQPYAVKVGDTFTVTATLVNNSTVPIELASGTCSSTNTHVSFFIMTFDNHTTTKSKNLTCAGVVLMKMLNPGKKLIGTSPDNTISYIATKSGTANVTVTFPYEIKNQTDSNQSNIDQTISKSFLFTILDNNTNIPLLHGGPPFAFDKLTPLQQFKSGVVTQNITCKEGFILAIKKQGYRPACVNPDTVPKLVLRGWSENPLDGLLLKYGNQTQANLVFYDILNESKIRDWSMKGWRYSDYSYASNGETHQSSATVHLYLPSNVGKHECENGSYGFVVINLKPVAIEHNYTEVGCEIVTTTATKMDPESNGK